MQSINMHTLWITAEEALAKLGSKRQTLYANVSRGRIRAKPDPADPRRSLYQADDVNRLAERHAGRRQAAVVAAGAIRWGEPVLQTTISSIAGGRLFYRGRDAIELGGDATLEDIATLLWQSSETVTIPAGDRGGDQSRLAATFACLAARIEGDLPALGRRPAILKAEAADVLASVAAGLAPSPERMPLHQRLALGWGRPEAAEPIRKCLVLTAEHELNVSAFAARVTASSGAALSAATLSGLATLTGPRHGAWLSVTRLAEQAAANGVREAIRGMLSSEGVVRAFGHRLYPDGDPRAKAIMKSFEVPALYTTLAEAGEELLGEPANLDFSLAALAATYDLPNAPLVIFALARTVGWLAHAMEQVESGELIRPRAHYAGS